MDVMKLGPWEFIAGDPIPDIPQVFTQRIGQIRRAVTCPEISVLAVHRAAARDASIRVSFRDESVEFLDDSIPSVAMLSVDRVLGLGDECEGRLVRFAEARPD